MAGDIFLKLDDIKGESIDEKHKGEIDITSYTWGATQQGAAHVGGGGGAGKVQFQDLTFTKNMCKASPLLLHLCATGGVINKALLTVRKAGGKPLEYMKLSANQVTVSSVVHNGPGEGDLLTETVSLNFANYSYEHVPQKADGSADASIVKGFDITANKPL